MEAFRFQSWLWLLVIPVVIVIVRLRTAHRRQPAVIFSSIAGLKELPVTLALRIRRLMPTLNVIALCLMAIGLARPQSGNSEAKITGEGIAIELVLDISGSMEALDFQLAGREVSRLDAVKHVINEFLLGSRASGLAGRKNDFVGLVAFGGFADSKCPLTLDHGALSDMVRELEIPKPIRDRSGRVINQDTLKEELGTAIGDGMAMAVDRLRDVKAKSKVIVLLTDGDNNAGVVHPREVATIAHELGIKVYTIGIGHNGVVPVPQEDEFGRKMLVSRQFRIDEDLLREIARMANGEYFHAADAEGLAKVYAQIDKMEKAEFGETKYSEYTELYAWFAGPGLLLALIVGVMNETRFRSLP